MADLIHNRPRVEIEQGENDPLKSYPARPLELRMRFGSGEVFEGIPPISELNESEIPYEPHVFRADEAEIYSQDLPARLKLQDPVILVMHGELRTDKIFPKFSKSKLDIYSLEEIVKSYERDRGLAIDLLAVCTDTDISINPDNSNTRLFSTLLQRPFPEFKDKVLPIYDKARVNIYRDEGKIKLVLSTNSEKNLYVPERFKQQISQNPSKS